MRNLENRVPATAGEGVLVFLLFMNNINSVVRSAKPGPSRPLWCGADFGGSDRRPGQMFQGFGTSAKVLRSPAFIRVFLAPVASASLWVARSRATATSQEPG